MIAVVNRASAYVKDTEVLTSGRCGLELEFQFSSDWDGLGKTAVFKAVGADDKYVILSGNKCVIPSETLANAGVSAICGVYGTDGEDIIIPTIYFALGEIKQGTEVTGSEPGAITQTLYNQVVALLAAATTELGNVKENAIKQIAVDASQASSVGTPSVSLVTEWVDSSDHSKGKKATFVFANLKGATGATGPQGQTGATGNGIASTVLNADYTLTITFTDGTSYTTPSIRGATGADGVDGNDGEDGFSPIVESVAITSGHRVSITDATHTETFDVIDGVDGETGATGNGIASAVLNADYTLTLTFTDGTSYTTPSIRGAQGLKGNDGQDGSDGFSPLITITEITGGHNVEITDAEHTDDFNVMDGADGENGQDGISPTITVTARVGGHRITITDATHTDVVDVMDGAGSGDMTSAVYDADSAVAEAGGIANYVDTNGGKIDHIKVNNIEQTILNKTVNIAVPDITSIEEKIPAQASASNQLADKNFVNSSIENVAAYYITKNAAGDPFSTKAELNAATTFYSGGAVRVPTRNDYCVVLADESKTIEETGEKPTTRYLYDNNTWSYQYIVNNSGLTASQWASVNSGIIADMIPTGASGTDKLAKSSDVNAKYTKPSGGIPKTDLASSVQTSLGRADSALQSHQTLKTINGNSIIGSGNVTIAGVDASDFMTAADVDEITDIEIPDFDETEF